MSKLTDIEDVFFFCWVVFILWCTSKQKRSQKKKLMTLPRAVKSICASRMVYFLLYVIEQFWRLPQYNKEVFLSKQATFCTEPLWQWTKLEEKCSLKTQKTASLKVVSVIGPIVLFFEETFDIKNTSQQWIFYSSQRLQNRQTDLLQIPLLKKLF